MTMTERVYSLITEYLALIIFRCKKFDLREKRMDGDGLQVHGKGG